MLRSGIPCEQPAEEPKAPEPDTSETSETTQDKTEESKAGDKREHDGTDATDQALRGRQDRDTGFLPHREEKVHYDEGA